MGTDQHMGDIIQSSSDRRKVMTMELAKNKKLGFLKRIFTGSVHLSDTSGNRKEKSGKRTGSPLFQEIYKSLFLVKTMKFCQVVSGQTAGLHSSVSLPPQGPSLVFPKKTWHIQGDHHSHLTDNIWVLQAHSLCFRHTESWKIHHQPWQTQLLYQFWKYSSWLKAL